MPYIKNLPVYIHMYIYIYIYTHYAYTHIMSTAGSGYGSVDLCSPSPDTCSQDSSGARSFWTAGDQDEPLATVNAPHIKAL